MQLQIAKEPVKGVARAGSLFMILFFFSFFCRFCGFFSSFRFRIRCLCFFSSDIRDFFFIRFTGSIFICLVHLFEAEAYALSRAGRSPRVAKQFVEYMKGMED